MPSKYRLQRDSTRWCFIERKVVSPFSRSEQEAAELFRLRTGEEWATAREAQKVYYKLCEPPEIYILPVLGYREVYSDILDTELLRSPKERAQWSDLWEVANQLDRRLGLFRG